METIDSLLLQLNETKETQMNLKQQLLNMSGSDERYPSTLSAFRQADYIVQTLVNELARQFQAHEDAFLDLSEGDRTLLCELGITIAPHEQTRDDLGTLVGKYRQAGAVFTATQKLNDWRMEFFDKPAQLDSKLVTSPDNIDTRAWIAAVTMFKEELEKLPHDQALADRQREAAYTVQEKALRAFDALNEELVTAVSELVDQDLLDLELSTFEPLLRNWLRDFVRLVPQRETALAPQTS